MTTRQICQAYTMSCIKRISKQALFVPCAAHSLNLVGSNAAEATSEGTRFYFNTQMVFNFFSSSTSRWELLEKYLNKIEGSLSIKNVCKTRWSSRYDVCKSLNIGYKEILNVLEVIYSDKNQRPAVCHEAKSIYKKNEYFGIFIYVMHVVSNFKTF